jgi:hypothetical protein
MALSWRSSTHVTETRTVYNMIDRNEIFKETSKRFWDLFFEKKDINNTLDKYSQDISVINCALLKHKRFIADRYPSRSCEDIRARDHDLLYGDQISSNTKFSRTKWMGRDSKSRITYWRNWRLYSKGACQQVIFCSTGTSTSHLAI